MGCLLFDPPSIAAVNRRQSPPSIGIALRRLRLFADSALKRSTGQAKRRLLGVDEAGRGNKQLRSPRSNWEIAYIVRPAMPKVNKRSPVTWSTPVGAWRRLRSGRCPAGAASLSVRISQPGCSATRRGRAARRPATRLGPPMRLPAGRTADRPPRRWCCRQSGGWEGGHRG